MIRERDGLRMPWVFGNIFCDPSRVCVELVGYRLMEINLVGTWYDMVFVLPKHLSQSVSGAKHVPCSLFISSSVNLVTNPYKSRRDVRCFLWKSDV